MPDAATSRFPNETPEHSDAAIRRADALKVWALSPNPMSIGMAADVEGRLIIESAFASYTCGVDVAAIITAHASCERDLLVRAEHWQELGEAEPLSGFQKWGLGSLIHFFRPGLPAELVAKLNSLNALRKTLYHYGHSSTEIGVLSRALAHVEERGANTLRNEYKRRRRRIPGQKELLEFATDEMLREQALESLEVALATRAWATAQSTSPGRAQ